MPPTGHFAGTGLGCQLATPEKLLLGVCPKVTGRQATQGGHVPAES